MPRFVRGESVVRSYNVVGYSLLILHGLVSALLAPPQLGPGGGLVVGVLYLLSIWLVAGIYLPEILHMGLAHRALEFKGWFVKSTTLLCNTVGIYVNPQSWVKSSPPSPRLLRSRRRPEQARRRRLLEDALSVSVSL